VLKSAYTSECGKYRYTLTRNWSLPNESTRTVVFVGLNPSTADAVLDDPTVRRCIGFAKTWGFNRLVMVNLFAFRATKPSDLKKAKNPMGFYNLAAILDTTTKAELTIAAWGAHGSFHDMGNYMIRYLHNPHHLGLTKNRQPKHPLYLKANVKPQPFVLGKNTC
jgi:hypothetical protein